MDEMRQIITIDRIREDYRLGNYSVRELWSRIHKKAMEMQSMNIWIHLLSAEEIEPHLSYIEIGRASCRERV